METKYLTIEEIQATLHRLRQNPKTQRNFPKDLWVSIIQLTRAHPIEEVCKQLQINPIYLKRKINQSEEQVLEFHEIPVQTLHPFSSTVVIELSSPIGMKAKIQGPISCLNYLNKFFGR